MTFYVISDLRLLGKRLAVSKDRVEVLESAYDLLRTFSGEESVWLPAFNFDFTTTGSGSNNPEEITTGVLNNFIRLNKAEWKSEDPLFSLVGWGDKPKTYEIKNRQLFPYGRNSIFEELINSDVEILGFGIGISDGSTFMHMVETNRPQGPMYRYWKNYTGRYSIGETVHELSITMHNRPRGFELVYDLPLLNNDLVENKITTILDKEANISKAKISEVYQFWLDRASRDPFYLLDKSTRQTLGRLHEYLGRDFDREDFE